jgi:hypothetical protein
VYTSRDLGDERRNRRLRQIVDALHGQPQASLPGAMGNQAALKAAYRFFDNPANKAASILASHIAGRSPLNACLWARDPETYAHLKDPQQRPIEEKESNKWLLSLQPPPRLRAQQ